MSTQGIFLCSVERESNDILGSEKAVDGSGDLNLHDVERKSFDDNGGGQGGW